MKGIVQWAAQPDHYGEGLILPELVFPETKEKKGIVKGEGTLRKETKSLLSHGLKEMASAQREFMENPDDTESSHKFRVKIRQFRSVLSFLKPATKTKEYEYFQGMLRELAQKYGYLRELDVMMSGMEEKYPALMEVLKKEREEEKKKVYSDIGGGASAQLYFELMAWINGNPVKNSKIAKNSFSWYANRRLKKWLSVFEEELDSVDFTDAKELHLLRIKGKKLRYLLALLEPILKEKYQGRLPEFKEIQDKLGRIYDIQR
jgi:CHAD domain-containing protein